MFRTAFIAVLALVALASNVEARQRHKATGLHPECNIVMPCVAPYASTPRQASVTRGRYVARSMGGFGSAIGERAARPRKASHKASYHVPAPSIVRAVASTVSGIVAPLAAKVAEIQASCGSQVISAVRHTYIAGTRRLSQHANGTAVDMSGNAPCIYASLSGWAGGYSVDYARMRHVHISFGGPEAGLRFVHGGHRTRHAHRRHHRHYASAP